jgi:hypothetical protein
LVDDSGFQVTGFPFVVTKRRPDAWRSVCLSCESDFSFARSGIPVTRSGIPVTRSGIPVTRSGIPVTRSGIPVTRSGILFAEGGVSSRESRSLVSRSGALVRE